MSINIDRFSYVEKLATLTQLYLELGLRLHDALRAAEADVWRSEDSQGHALLHHNYGYQPHTFDFVANVFDGC